MPEARDPVEAERIDAARAGSRQAYADLVLRYERPLFRFLKLRVGNRADAEELLQEVLLRGWTQLRRFDPERSFSAWIYTLATRIAISWRRKHSLPIASDRELDDLADSSDPAQKVEACEAGDNLWDLVSRILGESARSALWLSYGEGLSAREIGEILGRGEGAVRVLLCRARKRLAEHLRTETLVTTP